MDEENKKMLDQVSKATTERGNSNTFNRQIGRTEFAELDLDSDKKYINKNIQKN